jgi:SAM-dependent methyltransferase
VATFRDHFSHGASEYAAFRPRYPEALFAELVARLPGRALGWDVGTGNGQAAVALAEYLDRVVATDGSAAQIAAAEPHPRVEYRVARAEASGLPAASCDVVTVAQALHWFDLESFFAEVDRVLRPGGVFAAWAYTHLRTDDPALDATLDTFAHETVGSFWPPERAIVDAGYADIALPYPELDFPPLAIEATLGLDGLVGYVRTWSAVQRYAAARGHDPVTPLAEALRGRWGERRAVRWPIVVRACRKP